MSFVSIFFNQLIVNYISLNWKLKWGVLKVIGQFQTIMVKRLFIRRIKKYWKSKLIFVCIKLNIHCPFQKDGVKYVYIGQVKPDTEICKGVGILVYGNGYIAEGYWDNGLMNGLGRDIWTLVRKPIVNLYKRILA